MLKRVLMLVGALLVSGSVFAAIKVEVVNAASSPALSVESSIREVGTPTTVSISTSVWTMVPAASTLTGREGLMVSLPTTLNAVVVGHLADCTSTAIATTVRPLEFAKGGFVFVPVGSDVCLWVMSLHTAAESIHVQEIGQ